MPSPGFRQLPRYQRQVKAREVSREAAGYAVPHIDDIVASTSRQEAARKEYGAAKGQQLDLQKRRLDLSQRRLDASKDITDRNFAIDREMMDLNSERNKWATGIGVANVALETMGAVQKNRDAEEEAAQMQLRTQSFIELLGMYKGAV